MQVERNQVEVIPTDSNQVDQRNDNQSTQNILVEPEQSEHDHSEEEYNILDDEMDQPKPSQNV